jgi:biotin synthase
MGMGESNEDRVEVAFALRELDVDSVPVNFLDPRPGTPLGDASRLRPADCLRTLAMFRFVLPDKEIRLAGGREACLGNLQPLALYVANSFFTDGYLTTRGNGFASDVRMIEDSGFHLDGLEF